MPIKKNPKIEVRHLGMVYKTDRGGVEALKDINFKVHENEFVCLIGPSGCGKSTLLNIAAGILSQTSGEVLVGGKVVRGPSSDKAMVFQGYSLFPWLKVIDNIKYGPKIKGLPKNEREEIAKKYIKMVGLEEYETFYPKELSGGMKKRVDIARAYANNPEILLMDEPYGSLDAITKEKMQADLLDILAKENKTVLFVTHDIEEAIFLADRVILMDINPGRIKENFINPFPKPRDEELRTNKKFVHLRKRIQEKMSL